MQPPSRPSTHSTSGAEGVAVEVLIDAGTALAESLDLATTLGRVAELTVPRLADLCVIDLLAEDGTIRRTAVASSDERVARKLAELHERQLLSPDGEHPVARVIRSGETELRAEMTSPELSGFAAGSEHARFMIDHRYRSAIVAPLRARSRTLGALSVLRLGGSELYGEPERDVVSELARRAALAIDNARLFSAVRSVEQRLEAILVNLAEAITVTDESQQIVFANEAAAVLLGVSGPDELTGMSTDRLMERFLLLDEHGKELGSDEMPRRRLFDGAPGGPLLVRNIVRATGEERWLVARSSPVADPESGAPMYSVNVYEDITEVKRTQLAERFMAEASRVLASSMNYAETLQRVAELAIPQVADWCAIDVLDDDGRIERIAVQHRDPGKLAIAERLGASYGPTLDDLGGVAQVIRSGEASVHPAIRPDELAAFAHDEQHLAMLHEVGLAAVVIVPLAAPSRTIGAITLAMAESSRRPSEADVSLAVRLGRRAGTAVESARLYTERSRIADILQAALLPASLPAIPGVELEALYRPAGELNDVGGDFYDVYANGERSWLLTIGDVCGKGPRAAGVTALARHTLRTAAMLGQEPPAMLRTLHRALSEQASGTDMCTVCIVSVAPDAGSLGERELSVTLGGHPRPVLASAGGGVRMLGTPGTLLGVVDPIEITEVRHRLDPGDTLLLYTDGLPEAGRSGLQLGEQRVLELCATAPALSLQAFLAGVERAAVERADGRPRDDIALLAMRLDSNGV